MNQSYRGTQDGLMPFSIAIAYAKSDPEIRAAILSDGSFQLIWPMIAGLSDPAVRIGDVQADATRSSDATGNRSFDEIAESVADEVEMGGVHGSWKSFLGSPQFYVVTSTLVVILAAAGMYTLLDGKIDSLRLETKSDLQILEQRANVRFDKVDSRFDRLDSRLDKIDTRFEAMFIKMDADAKEMRSLLRDGQRPSS